jgi:hypothetical protein
MQTARVYWGRRQGRNVLEFDWDAIDFDSTVLVTASENRADKSRFVGEARVRVRNVQPRGPINGKKRGVSFVLYFDFPEPREVVTDITVLDAKPIEIQAPPKPPRPIPLPPPRSVPPTPPPPPPPPPTRKAGFTFTKSGEEHFNPGYIELEIEAHDLKPHESVTFSPGLAALFLKPNGQYENCASAFPNPKVYPLTADASGKISAVKVKVPLTCMQGCFVTATMQGTKTKSIKKESPDIACQGPSD